MARIRVLHATSKGTYGAPRLHLDLEAEGCRVGRKRVARLMKAAGLQGVTRRKWIITTRREDAARPAPDLLQRDFAATGPDQRWVADFTHVPTWSGFLYLAVVLDVWNRRVVGWAMTPHMRSDLVIQALDMAAAQRPGRGVIHHSDPGGLSMHLRGLHQALCGAGREALHGLGAPYDNVMAESFFATLNCELIYRCCFHTHAAARKAIFEYIEGWYNTRRHHSALGYQTPVTYRAETTMAA